MTRPPQISDAEWEVMKVLWESSPRTASDVVEALCEPMQWHPKTVKTLLGRLVKKGVVRFREEGNRYLYRPAFERERYVEQESRSFVDRVFGGDATPESDRLEVVARHLHEERVPETLESRHRVPAVGLDRVGEKDAIFGLEMTEPWTVLARTDHAYVIREEHSLNASHALSSYAVPRP